MSLGINGLSSALAGMRTQERAFDRAASQIAQSGLADEAAPPASDASSNPLAQQAGAALPTGSALADNMVEMLIAQRMFVAALRVAKTSDEVLQSSLSLGEAPKG
jgi:flagellar basal body rod protein FlgC